ncbi:MAG: hypothetical protein AAGE84_13090 [Cyanobacteria bacterium P01_G01_bin.39]
MTAYSAQNHNIRDNLAMPTATASFAIAANNPEELKSLLVWRIGDMGTEDLPDTEVPADLRQRAAELDYEIDIEAVSAKRVTAKLREAIKQNREPDIITFRDNGIIEGIETDSEKFAGVYSIEGVEKSFVFVTHTLNSIQKKGGFVALLKTSQNHDIAKQLALPELECGKTAETKLIDGVDRDAIENVVLDYTQTLFSDSKTEFKKYLSKSAIVGLAPGDMTGMPQKDIKVCSIVANNNLAVVSTVVAHDGGWSVGRLDMLLVLHQENDNWRLLTQHIGHINEDARPYINKLANSLTNSETNTPPLPASNLAPENIRPTAREKSSGEFTWQPSESENVVAEVIEFSHGVDARLFMKFREDGTRKATDSFSPGEIYPIDNSLNNQTWRWRVWSIAGDGSIAFSETQTF